LNLTNAPERVPLLRDERTALVQNELERILAKEQVKPSMNIDLTINTCCQNHPDRFYQKRSSNAGYSRSHWAFGRHRLGIVVCSGGRPWAQRMAVRLPYKASSADLLEHAQLLIDQYKVQSETIEITIWSSRCCADPNITKLRMGNIMARAYDRPV
jgi:hypothetical protein